MGVIENTISKRITKESASNTLLGKLSGFQRANVKAVSFPHDLKNEAQCTYMVIYILDNVSNNKRYSNTTFNSGVDKESYEIPAVTFLKEWTQQELDRLKQNLKDNGKWVVKKGSEWLESQAKNLLGDTVSTLDIDTAKLKEVGDWSRKWLVPRKVKTQSKGLKSSLDVPSGYTLVKAFAMQMPSSQITYKYDNGWESADTSTLNTIKALIEGVKNIFGNSNEESDSKKKIGDYVQSAKKELGGVITKITDAVGNLITGDGWGAEKQAQQRRVANPVLVFNYTVPEPRTFTFSFTLYPRNKEELYTLYNMIQELKFYALPEIGKGEHNRAIWFRYPAKFAVKFYTNGYENKWFPKTMALGLTGIAETLTGEDGDMSFFENYFDKESGNPPRVVKLTLNFKELGIMSREYAQAGY